MNKTLRALILTIMVGCFQPAQGVGWLWVAVKWGTPIIIGLLGKWYNQGNRIEKKVNKIDEDLTDGFEKTNGNIVLLGEIIINVSGDIKKEIKKVNDNVILLDKSLTSGFKEANGKVDGVKEELKILNNTVTNGFCETNNKLNAIKNDVKNGFESTDKKISNIEQKINEKLSQISDENKEMKIVIVGLLYMQSFSNLCNQIKVKSDIQETKKDLSEIRKNLENKDEILNKILYNTSTTHANNLIKNNNQFNGLSIEKKN